MKRKDDDLPPSDYFEHEWPEGQDIALTKCIHIEGYWMLHEPNETCWCEPEAMPVIDDMSGEVAGYIILHRGRQ